MKKFSIDANASWTPKITMEFLDHLTHHKELKDRVMMLEQPFHVEFLKIGEDKKLEEEWLALTKRKISDRELLESSATKSAQ